MLKIIVFVNERSMEMPMPTDEPINPPPETGEPSIVTPSAITTKVDSKQIRSLVDVLSADLRRTFNINLKPKDAELFARVGQRAVKFQIELRGYVVSGQLQDAAEKIERQRLQIESQLKAIKSIGSAVAAKKFWTLVNQILDRLSAFAVASVVAL